MIGDIKQWVEGSLGAILFLFIAYGALWIRKVFSQAHRNTLNEIDLSAKKISLDNSAKPIDKLVDDSNKSHGSNEMVPSPGDDDKKGK